MRARTMVETSCMSVAPLRWTMDHAIDLRTLAID